MWREPPKNLVLKEGDLHVWRAAIDLSEEYVWVLSCLLTPDELQRAERFVFIRDRARFIAARGSLRGLLGLYLNADPGRLRFTYNAFGKPSLDPSYHHENLHFNLAHSGDLALFAFTRDREVGVDLECLSSAPVDFEVAKTFFAPAEIDALKKVPRRQRRKTFYQCWTRKEAYIKAKGKGLSIPLDGFVVSVHPDQPARLISFKGDPEEASRWSIIAIPLGDDYVGSLVVAGNPSEEKHWRWTVDHLIRKTSIISNNCRLNDLLQERAHANRLLPG